MDFPLIVIVNSSDSGLDAPFGLGDTDYSIKYTFRQEKPESRWPAIAASFNIEPPTGSSKLQLGSGLIDYYLNGIIQKTLPHDNIWRINTGLTFASNTLTGVVGIKTRRTVLAGGTSPTHQFTRRLDRRVEIYGGHTANTALGRSSLQEQLGSNYEIRPGFTIDFGVIAGQSVGSPRHGFLLGFSRDF